MDSRIIKTCNPKAHNSKKATKVCETSTVLHYCYYTGQIYGEYFVAFSECINFNLTCQPFLL